MKLAILEERIAELEARNKELRNHCYEVAQRETEALIQILEQKAAIKCLQECVTQLRDKVNVSIKFEAQLKDALDKADHWEKTCHAQWESSQQAVDDCNMLSEENVTLKDANKNIRAMVEDLEMTIRMMEDEQSE